MDRDIDERIMVFLNLVLSGHSLGDYDYGKDEVQIMQLARSMNLVTDFDLEPFIAVNELRYYAIPKTSSPVSLTKEGYDFFKNHGGSKMPDNDNQKEVNFGSPSGTTVNIHNYGNINGSAFGSNNQITNHFHEELAELKKVASELPEEDQAQANEIIEIIESQVYKPGVFEKFETFLEKHPLLLNSVGKAITWALTNPDKLPLP
ncbi:hypothetical protein [Enterococcus gilvus]|uniref:Uncharacterized protein n=1 Tax=Enterococcus gilvus ATCC BAA-350 TaxID=1158614 RepID=R2XSB1_9ENTE|nr:hypothetical protein [Enterococcus gilvus]EOI57408.1 hypothetical protein UKC_01624 [Enterococcus gilvus ATCC BAA-350]EOW83018.1 hypothetical protein I592_02343 [Enterococcus gilvus ATCC BAA-350]